MNFAKFLRTSFLTEHSGGCVWRFKEQKKMKGENEHTHELVNMNFNFILDDFLNFISNINFGK